MARHAIFRYLGIAFFLVVLLTAPLGAAAAPRYPEKAGNVSDYADILSQQTVDDLNTFHDTLKNQTGVNLWVATVHFLDGEEITAYSKALFQRWSLGEEDLLLLMAAGEDSYQTVAGDTLLRRLPVESQQNLLAANFQSNFQNRQYDAAVSKYMPALSNLLGKQYGVAVSTAGLFGVPAATATPEPTIAPVGDDWQSFLWGENSFFSDWTENKATQKPDNVLVKEEKSSGISIGKIFILLLLFSLIFGSRRKHFGHRQGCMGCGCGPLGWIVAALGLGELFKDRN